MKNIFYALIILIFYADINSERLSFINSNTTQIIVKQNKLFYITNDDNDNNLYIHDLNTFINKSVPIDNNTEVKNKILLSLNDENFIIFGYKNNENSFFYKIYNSNNNYEKFNEQGSFELYNYNSKINIIILNEKQYFLYILSGNNLYIYTFNSGIISLPPVSKSISTNNWNLNTIECDSLNNETILCVYSLINPSKSIYFYYAFEKLDGNQLIGNEIKSQYSQDGNTEAASITKYKFNNEQKFIMCFIYKSTINSISQNYQLYCQTLGQNNNNELVTENINTIDNRLNYILVQSNYINNIPIKILVYNYTIYILLEMVDLSNIKKVELYGCSLDLKLCIKYHNEITFDRHFTNVNILINSFHNLIFYERIIGSKTNIFYEDLSFNCTNFEKQFTSENKNNDMRLTDDIITESVRNKYLAFSLDSSTYLKIGDKRYFGSLEEATKLDGNKQIYLQYLSNSQITHNYYIIYNIDNTNEFNFYIHLSHFCYFKVINCQENCSLCHSEIVGNSESHQCKTCIPGYYKYNNGKNDKDYYNCYQEGDPNIPKNMYVNKSEEEFKYCNESCSECYYKDNCKSCNIGYYFKVDENSTNTIKDNRCFREAPDNYYLNITSNITFEEQIVRFVYKPCYNTCKTCLGDDNPINNNCLECRSDFIKYPFDDRKCTINKTNCSAYWKIENHTKNIECINNCSGYIIKNVSSNLNQQCVDNCNNFLNPYSEYYLLLSFECGGEKVCITFEECISRGLKYDNKNCYPDGNSCFYVPRTTIPVTTPIPPTEPPTEPPDIIENRVRFIKNFEIKKEYSEIKNNFEINQLQNYIKEFGREFNLGIYKNGLDFITFSKYKDFIITIYPLDTEDFVKEDLFNLKSLCYANFSKLFLNYKNEDDNYKILIGLIEYENDNLPINTVNYFFMLFNEKERNGQIITNLTIDNNIIDISYPLYNYEHENISAKYSTELINTIKELNDIDENFNFFEKDNSFYNDICYTQTFDKDIDITIKDRIKEYYIEISFCEKGCTFKYIYDKDKNPKSFCECKLKKILDVADSNYSFNTTIKERESVSNFKALSCYGEVFSSELSSNPSFWIYLIVIFIHLALFISIIFCSKQAIQKMLKSKKENLINIENNNTYINNNDNKSVNIVFHIIITIIILKKRINQEKIS